MTYSDPVDHVPSSVSTKPVSPDPAPGADPSSEAIPAKIMASSLVGVMFNVPLPASPVALTVVSYGVL